MKEKTKTGAKCTKQNQKSRTQKGITLIALVITIIVLLILAGVAINLALDANGLFEHANKAVTEYNDGVAKEQEAIQNILQQADDLTWVKPTFKVDDVTIREATEKRTGDYGKLVEGYNVTTEEYASGKWRLFYQDSKYTYLITDELVGSYNLLTECGEEPEKYTEGATVGTIGKRLNKKLLEEKGEDFFTYRGSTNILGTKWLTDTENWAEYAQGDAEYAIGAPTVDLFAASYNNNTNAKHTSEYKKETIGLHVVDYGYSVDTNPGWFNKDDSHGIYNKTGFSDTCWWLASPGSGFSRDMIMVQEENDRVNGLAVNFANAARPVVCIQTPVFERGIEKGTYVLKDE